MVDNADNPNMLSCGRKNPRALMLHLPTLLQCLLGHSSAVTAATINIGSPVWIVFCIMCRVHKGYSAATCWSHQQICPTKLMEPVPQKVWEVMLMNVVQSVTWTLSS